ncbi:MAG: hypothetical protein ACE366_30950 [Bradymonadia bacterium]
MKALLRKIYTLPVFINTGRPLFFMSKFRWLEPLSLRLARCFAWMVHFTYGRRPQTSAEDLAQEWNRLMPRPRTAFPVVDTDGETAFVEIHVECPLRGSGHAEACWRSMEFDRALIQASGGRLVVMESQSVTGATCCKLAIRPAGADFDDLPVAHPRWRT